MTDFQPQFITKIPTLHLIYSSDNLPSFNQQALEQVGPLPSNIAHSPIIWSQRSHQKFLGAANFNNHQIHVAGLTLPLPQELINRTVMVSPWPGQVKASMRHHRTHLSLIYNAGSHDPIEQMIALYTLAHAFENEDLLGIINPNAWTAHPAANFLSAPQIASYRKEMPFSLWIGYVRFYLDDNSFWLVTKGHHIFDVPDLAYFVEPGQDPQKIIELFINLFHYLNEDDVFVTAGDTLEVGSTGQVLHFAEVTELEEDLMGPIGTLVVTPKAPES